MRSVALYCLLAVTVTPTPFAAEAAITRIELNIPRQPLDAALNSFSEQTHIQVARMSDRGPLPSGDVGPLSGAFEPRAALEVLLKDTGFGFQFVNPRMVRIYDASSPLSNRDIPPDAASHSTSTEEEKTGPSGEFRMAQVGPAQTGGAAALKDDQVKAADSSKRAILEEVVVTAQKREERLQDVPVPVTALSAQALIDSNQVRLQDYFSSVPGLSLNTDDFGTPLLSIRGLSTGTYTNPTVGISVDDVPFGSSSALAAGQEVPDLDPSDLARIEVLRGPQGTLYGASSLGGLLKYVTVDPSTQALAGHIQAGLSDVYNGAQLGYHVRGAANIPLTDDLAIRVSGFDREDPGYVDNPFLGRDGVNKETVYGGRLSALWKPSDSLSLKLSGTVQRTTIDGSPYSDIGTGLGDLQQTNIADTGWFQQTLQAYSAILNAKLGAASLTSVTGYNINIYSDSYDYTPILGTCPAGYVCTESLFGVSGTPVVQYQSTRKFTQEVRLDVPLASKVDWLLGGFFDHEDSPGGEDILASIPTTGVVVGDSLHVLSPSKFQEYAAFTDVTFHITDRFDIQVGGRESWDRQISSEVITGAFVPTFYGTTSPAIYPRVQSDQSAFTYLLTPSFHVSPDLLLYARFASGYRPGGSNGSLGGIVPPTYGPDTTHNYEIGAKGDALNSLLSFDASLYYIDWNNIQINLTDPQNGGGYIGNGSRAKSQGIELSVEVRPTSGLTVSGWVAGNDAVLTENFPSTSPAIGNEGDRLPFSSKFAGHLGIQQKFPIASRWRGFVGAAESYVGERLGNFGNPYAGRQDFPGYARTDLQAGLKYDAWSINLFVNNLTDKRATLYGGLQTFNPAAFQFIQPRTIGVSVTKSFGE